MRPNTQSIHKEIIVHRHLKRSAVGFSFRLPFGVAIIIILVILLLLLLLIIMEICKEPTLRLKALNKHNTRNVYRDRESVLSEAEQTANNMIHINKVQTQLFFFFFYRSLI